MLVTLDIVYNVGSQSNSYCDNYTAMKYSWYIYMKWHCQPVVQYIKSKPFIIVPHLDSSGYQKYSWACMRIWNAKKIKIIIIE